METLEHRPGIRTLPADAELTAFLEQAKDLATSYNISVGDVIAARRVLDLERYNWLKRNDAMARDEQLARFGPLLQALNQALERIAANVGR
jgi:hypothetical protein